MSTIIHPTREQWLQAAVDKLKPIFLGVGFTVPELRISCGFPSKGAMSTKRRVIGECWGGLQSADGKPQLFISPFLHEPLEEMGVLATVVHEVIHATIGTEAQHGPKFKKAMGKLGLEGKPTSTHAGAELLERLKPMMESLGDYPHSELKLKTARKKQTTRMIKCECSACGYVARTASKWITEVGTPICPGVGHGPMKSDSVVELPGDDDENESE